MVHSMALVSMSCPFRLDRGRADSLLSALAEHDLFRANSREKLAHADRQPFLDQRVVDPIGIPTFQDQAGILQHAQMPGYRRSTDCESRSDITSGELNALKILENLAPRWVSESPEYSSVIIHRVILANVLITISRRPGVNSQGAPIHAVKRFDLREAWPYWGSSTDHASLRCTSRRRDFDSFTGSASTRAASASAGDGA